MRRLPRAHRALDVRSPFELYVAVGRRPSAVFLDAARQPTASAAAPERLNEVVYRRRKAEPGEQIQVVSSQTVLLDAKRAFHPVLLSEPKPLVAEAAFTHAQRQREAEDATIERLVADGVLAEAVPVPPAAPMIARADQVFPADHPLVAQAKGPADGRSPARRAPGKDADQSRPAT